MVRSAPSAADRAMIEALAEEGARVSAGQLHEWRANGLLPKPQLARSRRGTSVHPPADDDLRTAYFLAGVSRRGRPWQIAGVDLFESTLPLRMNERCVQDCAAWLVQRGADRVARVWEQVYRPRPDVLTDDEFLLEVEQTAQRFATSGAVGRQVKQLVAADLLLLPFYSGRDDVAAAVHRALGLRLIDIVGGGPFSPEVDHVARYGHVHAPSPPWPFALHSELIACARTMTLRETDLERRRVVALYQLDSLPSHLMSLPLLQIVVLSLANHRASEPPYEDPGTPLSGQSLHDFERDVRALEREVAAFMRDAEGTNEAEKTD